MKDKLDFHGASLKFKARSNTLPLNGKLSSWEVNNDGMCLLCKSGCEDLKHFMLSCKSLHAIRDNEFHNLELNLRQADLSYVWNFFNVSDNNTQLCLILGSTCLNVTPMVSKYSYDDALIDKQFDVFCKSYLKRAWSCRTALLNNNS